MDPVVEADDRTGADHLVEPEPLGDRVCVKPVGGGRQDEPAALRFVARDGLARAGTDVRCHLPLCEALDERSELARVDSPTEQEAMINLLEPGAVD